MVARISHELKHGYMLRPLAAISFVGTMCVLGAALLFPWSTLILHH